MPAFPPRRGCSFHSPAVNSGRIADSEMCIRSYVLFSSIQGYEGMEHVKGMILL